MNWKKSLFVVMLMGITVLAMVGCGKAEEAAPAAEPTLPAQPTPSATQPTPSSPAVTTDGSMPLPPQGQQQGERPSAPAMDLAAAAAKLGVTEPQLREALGELQGPPDLATAAGKLGISEKSLQEALGFSGNMTPPGGPPPVGPGPTAQGQ